ncbi:MAG: glycosyltransferase [Acidobacteria bacterium]|nr:glycosyltransferase [Acidobacteriota bacterium]
MSAAIVLIPAYRPQPTLLDTVNAVLATPARIVVIVDDGSGPQFRALFDALASIAQVRVVRHAVNLGKGAALRSGINYALSEFPDCPGIITADADGQHHPEDIRKVDDCFHQQPDALVLGVREFDSSTPLRNRLGNQVTRHLFRLLHGVPLADTQTGLRGIPRALAERLLRLEARGYEFELDMLIAARRLGIPFVQVQIRAIYLAGNESSHFNPLIDSMRVYFVLLRFAASSVITTVIDNLIFYLTYRWSHEAVLAQVIARSVALLVNYNLSKQVVFLSPESGTSVWLRYLALVAVSGTVSFGLMHSLRQALGLSIMPAKIAAECALFLFNFAFLRDFVFSNSSIAPKATDWSSYYKSVPPTAKITRRYTANIILDSIRAHGFDCGGGRVRILEFGGANSCFLEAIVRRCRPREYHVADTNPYGLELLRARPTAGAELHVHQADILKDTIPGEFDLVFSIGLIEHFDAEQTAECITAHFHHVKRGGMVLISFPTPTLLYRITRGFLEAVGLWKFPDERPLRAGEVLQSIEGTGTVLFQKTLWPLLLTQHMILARKP